MKLKNALPAVTAGALIAIAPYGMAQVKIGFSAPLSGSQAVVGQDQVDGFMLAIEQLGGKLGGQAVTVIKEDDQLKPEIGNQIVRKFIEKDKVDAIVGLGFSNVLMAGLKPIVESGTVAIATNAGPSPIAGANCAPNMFSDQGAAYSQARERQTAARHQVKGKVGNQDRNHQRNRCDAEVIAERNGQRE